MEGILGMCKESRQLCTCAELLLHRQMHAGLTSRSRLEAIVGHVDISMDAGHWVLEVRAVDGGLPELGAAFQHWLALLP